MTAETTTDLPIADVTKAGAIQVAANGHTRLPKMEIPNAAIGDSFFNPGGSRLASGFFELKAGEALEYQYTYDEMKFVVKGEFHLTDLGTGESIVAKAGEIIFFPKGVNVKFETPEYALGCFTGDRDFPA
ncbi:cupin domain-containing protein [Brevibacterium litoralis]|uniref:cupin domain-containing protein n=1 Tax=Brevibacterium litoralis TaxID=3138935 RepID=UPI0032EC293B